MSKLKLVSWNVNGIRAILKKDFLVDVKKMNPDVLCLQETKAHPDQVEEMLKEYEHHYWNSAVKKGYSGTAIFSRVKPLSVKYGIGIEEHDQEGRVICVEFENFFLVTCYTPNSGRGLVRLEYRQGWDKAFLKFLKELEKEKSVVICGDLNVAHTDIDLKNAKSNYNKTAGYTQAEIDGIDNLISSGFVDTFRMFNKEGENYTYWSYMFSARLRNIGWRIDYFLVSENFISKVKDAKIHSKVLGSDHCPVEVVVDV
jgi:exodeoxyribonuclease-3